MNGLLLALALLAQTPSSRSRAELLASCADCHAPQVETYARTGMARALEALRPGELEDLAPVAEERTGFTYAFEGDGARARVVESFTAAGEELPWRDSAPIAFAVGAGELDRSYVVKRHRRFWFAPLEVLGHGAERHAALAPAHAMTPGLRFTQPVTPECLSCHTDAPPPRDWPLNRAAADWEPTGISCAACHGDLEGHVRAREAELGGGGEARTDPLLAEREWTRVARMERCAACHLQGDARIELEPGRLGPPPPGTPLIPRRAVFVAREPSNEIGFVSHVERLVLSPCYLESASFPGGGLSCESCHDPHRTLFEPVERARVRGACLACHEPVGNVEVAASDCALPRADRPDDRDCVDCHMRRTGVFDVEEVRIHDHWIRADPGPPSPRVPLRFPEAPDGDWRIFAWPDEGAPAAPPADDHGLWTMALMHGGHPARALERLRAGTGTAALELPMLYHVRGTVLEAAGDHAGARVEYERALAFDPELPDAAINLGPILAQLGDAEAGRELLDALIRRHPLADSAYRNRAAVRLALGDEAGFLQDLEAAMHLLPSAALAQALARFHAQKGDAAEEQRWTVRAAALDPRLRGR